MYHNDSEDQLLTKEEEAIYGIYLRRALIRDKPNPDRIGCPAHELLRDVVYRKRMNDTEAFDRVVDHLVECSPCARDTLMYAELYKCDRGRRRVRFAALGVAAAVVLSIGVWQFWRTQPRQEFAAKPPAVSAHLPVEAIVADAGKPEIKQPAPPALRFEDVTIEVPSTWRGPVGDEHPIILPRGHLRLEVRLPLGSPDGDYRLRILDASKTARMTLRGTARTTGGITRFKATIDTSHLSPGKYKLSVLQPHLDEWFEYLLEVK
jgi:hypothetical protein